MKPVNVLQFMLDFLNFSIQRNPNNLTDTHSLPTFLQRYLVILLLGAPGSESKGPRRFLGTI